MNYPTARWTASLLLIPCAIACGGVDADDSSTPANLQQDDKPQPDDMLAADADPNAPVADDQVEPPAQPMDTPELPEDMLGDGELPDPVEEIPLEPIAGANIVQDHGTWAVLDLERVDCTFRTAIGAVAESSDFSVDRITNEVNEHRLMIDEGSLIRAITTHLTLGDNHEHEVVFESEALQELHAGTSVVVQTQPGGSARCPHIHNVTVHACNRPTRE